jgi:hypothetical protein
VLDTGTAERIPPTQSGRPGFVQKELTMSWNNKPGILPFDTRPDTPKPAGWYRFTVTSRLTR